MAATIIGAAPPAVVDGTPSRPVRRNRRRCSLPGRGPPSSPRRPRGTDRSQSAPSCYPFQRSTRREPPRAWQTATAPIARSATVFADLQTPAVDAAGATAHVHATLNANESALITVGKTEPVACALGWNHETAAFLPPRPAGSTEVWHRRFLKKSRSVDTGSITSRSCGYDRHPGRHRHSPPTHVYCEPIVAVADPAMVRQHHAADSCPYPVIRSLLGGCELAFSGGPAASLRRAVRRVRAGATCLAPDRCVSPGSPKTRARRVNLKRKGTYPYLITVSFRPFRRFSSGVALGGIPWAHDLSSSPPQLFARRSLDRKSVV